VVVRPVEQLAVLLGGTFVVQSRHELVEPRLHSADVRQGVVQHVPHGRRRRERQFLPQETAVRGPLDHTVVRLLDAREQPQQRRLACTVLPDETDAPAGCRVERHPVQHTAVAVGLHQVLSAQRRNV
jgi:hypothetical protein